MALQSVLISIIPYFVMVYYVFGVTFVVYGFFLCLPSKKVTISEVCIRNEETVLYIFVDNQA